HNKPPLIGCISLDITGQKQAEENLRESEKRYRELYDFLPIPVYEMDFQSTITSVNHAIYETFGGTEEDFKRGFKAWQLLTPEAVEQSVENIQRLLNGEPLGGTEYRLKRLDGTEFPAIVFSRLIFEQGKPVGLRGAVVNITDRKRTEEVIRESEANFRRSMDDSPLGIRVVTADGETLYANRAILDMYGYASIEEFQGVPLKQRYTPESYAAYLARRAKRDRGERDQTEYTIDIVTQNGDIRNVRAFRKQIVWNGQPHDQIIYQDITRQIQAEEALRESVGNLRKALGGTIRAIASVVETKDPYTAGHQRRVADIARAIAQEMKLPRERIDGLRMAGIIHDIGKVSVPSEILSSPRKLSSLEFSLIKTHAQSGHDIVREIEFPWPIARIIIEHHERMDGSGYPNALTGDQILPESRILAVADVVEAMATHRPYRPSLGLEAALDEITQNRGRLYDPEVVDACLRLFREKDYTIRD
ncbi:MAG: PAS domain S-box protein, partial [Smithellaceae bacterium]|nr:PAS domain S-box protein [Smithellaceae bacterium]